MALNLEDLIGSMQHNLSAGDRGNDIHDIRESLLVSLGPGAMGPNGSTSSSQRRSNSRQPYPASSSAAAATSAAVAAPPPSQHPHPAGAWMNGYPAQDAGGGTSNGAVSHDDSGSMDLSTSLDNAAGSSDGWGAYSYGSSGRLSRLPPGSHAPQPAHSSAHHPNAQAHAGPQVGSFGANSYSSSGSLSSAGHGFVAAPANTPQQTPVERSTLADHFVQARDAQGQRFRSVAEDEVASPASQDGSEAVSAATKITRGFGDAQGPGSLSPLQ